MALGLTEEHVQLAETVRGWAQRNCPPEAVRAAADGPDSGSARYLESLAPGLAEQGVLGLHVPEEDGGQGYGLPELAVALEELGRALVPGAFLPTVACDSSQHCSAMRRLRCSSQLACLRCALATAASASRCMASTFPDVAPACSYSATAELRSWRAEPSRADSSATSPSKNCARALPWTEPACSAMVCSPRAYSAIPSCPAGPKRQDSARHR